MIVTNNWDDREALHIPSGGSLHFADDYNLAKGRLGDGAAAANAADSK